MAKKTTTKKKPASGQPKKPDPAAKDREKQLERETAAVEKRRDAIVAKAEAPGPLTNDQAAELQEARAELVAAQEAEKSARERNQRAREIREKAQDELNDLLGRYLPLPVDEVDPDQQKLFAAANAELPAHLREKPIHDVPFFTAGAVEKLRASGIETIGEFDAKIRNQKADWWTTIQGLGDRTAEKLANQFLAWKKGAA